MMVFMKTVVSFEKVCCVGCLALGVVFLIVAISGMWHHLLTMSLCFSGAILCYQGGHAYGNGHSKSTHPASGSIHDATSKHSAA